MIRTSPRANFRHTLQSACSTNELTSLALRYNTSVTNIGRVHCSLPARSCWPWWYRWWPRQPGLHHPCGYQRSVAQTTRTTDSSQSFAGSFRLRLSGSVTILQQTPPHQEAHLPQSRRRPTAPGTTAAVQRHDQQRSRSKATFLFWVSCWAARRFSRPCTTTKLCG